MRVAILGCGNMGRAIVSGLLKATDDCSIIAFDKSDDSLKHLPDEALVVPCEEWGLAENRPDAVIIAVKPQDMADALAPLAGLDGDDAPVFISIAAGITIAKLEKILSSDARICRVMPNTPALVGEAMSGYCVNSRCTSSDTSIIEQVLGAIGKFVSVPEKLINAVTGLSGSGPAYVYVFIEALIEGGVAAGLPYSAARECAVQTVLGAAKMVQETGENPSVLKSRVMSPGGTTVSGLLALEQNKFKYAVIKAVGDATSRANELGKLE